MNRRDFLKNCAIAAIGYGIANSLPANAKSLFANKDTKLDLSTLSPNNGTKPNIILCMADDLGRGDVSYNGHPVIKTPNLDKLGLAQTPAIRFDRWYTGAPVCSPTRGSCVTGRHPFRYGIYSANIGHMKPDEITLAEALKTQGYTTAHFGKWHMGTLTTKIKDGQRGGVAANAIHFSPPWNNGFDVCFSTESKVPTWDPMVNQPETSKYWIGPDSYVPVNDPTLAGDDARVIMDRALPFIRNAVTAHKPFFAVIWFHTCHEPYRTGGDYKTYYQNLGCTADQVNYYGAVNAMDDQFGRLRQELKTLNIADNTMLWFSSDNGPEVGTPGVTGNGTDVLRGRKRDLYEGGVRVAGLLEWPDKIKSHRIINFPCSTLDYYPTILDVLGFQMPNQVVPLDGVSLKPLIEGDMTQRNKVIGFQHADERALIGEQYKIVSYNNGATYELYDIVNDKYETANIASQHPDIVNSMKTQLEAWIVSCANSDAGGDYD